MGNCCPDAYIPGAEQGPRKDGLGPASAPTWRFSPTPATSATTGIPCSCSACFGPIPLSCRIWGVCTAPAASNTSPPSASSAAAGT